MKLQVTILLCLCLASSSSLRQWPRFCGSRLTKFLAEQCPQATMECPETDDEELSLVSQVVDCCLKPCSIEAVRQLCCTYAKEQMGAAKPVKFTASDIYMLKEGTNS
ncbi:unnamed protein product [Auanema sp. JU1783]|nr:unnamed protein product [Auanema sp. JU1783]